MTYNFIIQLILGFFLAALIAFGAMKARALSRSGGWGALLTGTVIFGLGGWQWGVLLLGFFVSSSLLTRFLKRNKASLNEKFDKGGERDIWQVLANGGIGSLFAILHLFFPDASWPWLGFAASMAAVNADTWATELGVLSPQKPRLVSNWRPVERGTSGGVSWHGTLAAMAGAGFIALLAVLCSNSLGLSTLPPAWEVTGIVLLGGVLGALFDSFLGATVQAIYHCPQCDKETEKHPLHTCGTETQQTRGWKWLNNDLVNVGCALLGAITGALL